MKRNIRQDFELKVSEVLGLVPENVKFLRAGNGYNHTELTRLWHGFQMAASLYLKEEQTNVHGDSKAS